MATGQGILDRLKKAKETPASDTKAGVLPLAAFYGRDPEQEWKRDRMYAAVERALAFREENFPEKMRGGRETAWTLVDFQESVVVVNANSSPIEFLVSRGELQGSVDPDGMGGVRFHTALRLRDLIDGARVNGMKSPSFDGGGGGGGGKAADIRGYQLDCMNLLGRVKKAMPASWIFPMLEAVVFMDDWLDLWPDFSTAPKRRATQKRQRAKTIKALHFALDITGLTLGYLADLDFKQRWNLAEPSQPPSARRHTRGSTASNQLALLTSRGVRKR